MNITHELLTQTAGCSSLATRHGSFSRAGEAIGLTQSAVSHSVKELEAEVGVRLLDHTTREVVLTDAACGWPTGSKGCWTNCRPALLDARSFGVQRSGTVRVATSQTISAHLMPQCIAAGERNTRRSASCCAIRAQQQVLHSVRNAEVDFGIVVDPVQAVDLECEAVLHEPFLLLCRDDHPFAAQQEVRWSALNGCRLVFAGLRVGQPAVDRQRAEAAEGVESAGGAGNRPSGHALFLMVAEGIGISIFPALACRCRKGAAPGAAAGAGDQSRADAGAA